MVTKFLVNVVLVLLAAVFQVVGAQDSTSLLADIGNFTVTSNVPLTITALPSIQYTVFPNGVTIQPLGKTTIIFTISSIASGTNLTKIPVNLMVPVTNYMGFPVTGPASKTICVTLGESLGVTGFGEQVMRLFYGISWQTYPQLRGVLISNRTWVMRTRNVTTCPNETHVQSYLAPVWIQIDNFTIPTLCM